ncbi:MAG: potassium transporter [Methylobacteriaceae bacterium]|nr:potassium transporter [Methylobacteriaceae bacterium]MBV9703607.1 potassium transporter [Methylobacteriaceae bacterium]
MRPRARIRTLNIGPRPVLSVGLTNNFWNDLYHQSMTVSWPLFLAGAAVVFFLLNATYALLLSLGEQPIANAPPGLSIYLLYFSIETLATVGYGDLHPQTHYGHIVASVEMFTGLIYAAVVTGLIFARFARPRPRFVFANVMTVSMHDGRKTLVVRVANARHNYIANATAKLWALRDEVTAEGREYRRFHELRLERQETPTFILSWSLFHVLDETSPLFGMTRRDFETTDVSFVLSVQGRDENFAQEMHARKSYSWRDVRWEAYYSDIFRETNDGKLLMDYTAFHDVEPEKVE